MTRRVLLFCVSVEVLFVLLDYHINYSGPNVVGAIRRLFNTTREDALPSVFSVLQTFSVGLTLWFIYLLERRRPDGTKWRRRGWLVLAVFFTYMAVDDGCKLHERVGTAFSGFIDAGAERVPDVIAAFPSYTWQLVFLPFFGAVGLFTVGFIWRLAPDRLSRVLVLSGIGCFVLAVSLDFFEGLEPSHPLNIYVKLGRVIPNLPTFTHQRFGESAYDTLRHFSKSSEEAIEMLGNTLLWVVFLRYLTTMTESLSIRFRRT